MENTITPAEVITFTTDEVLDVTHTTCSGVCLRLDDMGNVIGLITPSRTRDKPSAQFFKSGRIVIPLQKRSLN